MRFFFKHLLFVVAAYIAATVVSHMNYRFFAKATPWILAAVLAILLVTAFSSTRWISLPIIGRFQPSEIAKILTVAFTAKQLAVERNHIDRPEVFNRIFIPMLLVAFVVLKDNFSMGALIFITCFTLMYFGGINRQRWIRLLLISLLFVGGALAFFATHPDIEWGRSMTWVNRIVTWMNPDPDVLSQENIAKMAVARGGLTGQGVGSTVHARLMTEAHNDFIFAIIIEETGAIAAMAIFAIYSFIFLRCIAIARRTKGRFGSMLVLGLALLIYYQALVNMFVAVGALPVTGQTLPLISYGGTAYLCMGLTMGMIQSVASDTALSETLKNRPQNPTPKPLAETAEPAEPIQP